MHLNRSFSTAVIGSNSVNALVKSVSNFKDFFFFCFLYAKDLIYTLPFFFTLKQLLNVYLVLSANLTYLKVFYLLLFIIFNFLNSF